MSQPCKYCPTCRQMAAVDALYCGACGHKYRTKYVPPNQASASPFPPNSIPPGYAAPRFTAPAPPPPTEYSRTIVQSPGSPPAPPPPSYTPPPFTPPSYPPPGAPQEYQGQPYPPPYNPQGYNPPPYDPQSYGPQGYYPPSYGPHGYPVVYQNAGMIQLPPGIHSTSTAVIVAFLITGGGQMCNKQIGKGMTLLLSAMVLALPTAFLAPLVLGIVGIIDASMIAGRLHRGEAVGAWQWF